MRCTALLAAAVVCALAPVASAFTIVPTFTDAAGEMWNSTEEAVVNQAISEWESMLSYSSTPAQQNIPMTFTFANAGTGAGAYLAQWNGNYNNVPNGTSLNPWSPQIVHTIDFNADLMVPTTAFGNVTLEFNTDASVIAADGNWDALTAVRHEIGHALGFTTLYTDSVGGPNSANKYQDFITTNGSAAVFDQTVGGLNVNLYSSSNIAHILDPNDLMNVSIVNGTRKPIGITDLQVEALSEGYTITVPTGISFTTTAMDTSPFVINGTLDISSTTAAAQSRGRLLTTNNLTFGSGGLMDLANHDLLIHGGISITQTQMLIASGKLGAVGITSSSASPTMGLGYATAGSVKATSFDGITVSPTDILIKYTFYGDVNLDGGVNITDLNVLAANWQDTNATWAQGDFNGDGIVNIADLNLLATNWQQGTASGGGMSFAEGLAIAFTSTVSVPEPASLAILILGSALLLRRRPA